MSDFLPGTQSQVNPERNPLSVGEKPQQKFKGGKVMRNARLCIIAALALLSAGCWPKYDWRDFRPDCSRVWCGVVATFPARVQSSSREVALGGVSRAMTLHVASVGAVSFAIGTIQALPGGGGNGVTALKDALVANLAASVDSERSVILKASDRSAIAALAVDARGMRGKEAVRMSGRFASHAGQLIEAVVIGPADLLARPSGREAIETFLTSLRFD